MAAIVATEAFGAKEKWQTDFVEYILSTRNVLFLFILDSQRVLPALQFEEEKSKI